MVSAERDRVRVAWRRVLLGLVELVSVERDRVRVAGPPSVGRLILFAGLCGLRLVRVELRVDIG